MAQGPHLGPSPQWRLEQTLPNESTTAWMTSWKSGGSVLDTRDTRVGGGRGKQAYLWKWGQENCWPQQALLKGDMGARQVELGGEVGWARMVPQRPRPLWGPPGWTVESLPGLLPLYPWKAGAAAHEPLHSCPILPLCQLLFVPHTRAEYTAGTPCPQSPSPRGPTLASCLQPAAGRWLVPAGR